MRKSIALAVVAVTASLFISTSAHAVTGNWIGPTNGVWSDPANWQDNLVPNAAGDTAQYTTGGSRIVLNDVVGGVTVGTLKVLGTANSSLQFTPNTSIFLNQDGAGPLSASVINDIQTPTPAGNPAIFLNAGSGGTFVLQDNLFISNTSNSARTTGSVQIRGPITGNGNIWIENNSNNIIGGQVAFTNNQSSAFGGFGGNVTIAKGAVTFNRGDIFTPSPGNIVTIGAAGMGAATLAAVGNGLGNIENGFVAAANAGGELVFANDALNGAPGGGSTVPSINNIQIKSTNTNAAVINLLGDLTFSNLNTAGSIFIIGDPIVGPGTLTKKGAGPMEITHTNSYSGGTVVQEGSLKVRHADAINNGFGFYEATDGTLGSGDVTVTTFGTKVEIDSTLAAIDVIANTATLSLAGGGSLATPDFGYIELGAGINETIGGLILGGTAQTTAGTYGSTASGADNPFDEYFSGPGLITLTSAAQAGDHNGDGIVDAADYVVWRKGLDPSGGAPAGYDAFVENFGEGGPGGGGAAGVPEPTTLVLLGLIATLALTTRRRRT